MKKFDFRLDKLMSYKEQTLGNERMTLAALNSEMERARARLEALAEEKAKCGLEMEQKRESGELTPLDCQIHYQYETRLSEEISASRRIIAQIQGRIDRQAEVIKNIKLETKSLETVRKSKLAHYRKEESRAAEIQIDEFVNASRAIGMARA